MCSLAAVKLASGASMHNAVTCGNKAEITRLLDSGTDVDTKDEVSTV